MARGRLFRYLPLLYIFIGAFNTRYAEALPARIDGYFDIGDYSYQRPMMPPAARDNIAYGIKFI